MMGKVLSGELNCMGSGLVINGITFLTVCSLDEESFPN